MTPPRDRPRRPARLSRWAASGLTAAATIGAVGAMAEAAPDGANDEAGTAIGTVARFEGEVAAAAMMSAAEAGSDEPAPIPPPTIARADVS